MGLAVTCMLVGCRQSMTPTTNIWSRGADVSGALHEESSWSSTSVDQPVALASFEEPVVESQEALPEPSSPVPPEPVVGDRLPAIDESLEFLEFFPDEPRAGLFGGALTLDVVIESVYSAYPLLEVALRERQIAGGKALSAWGEFDLGMKGFSIAAPMGYYKNYRSALALTQPTFGGGYLYGGYKIGDDDVQPWFKERLTNEGGEFALGLGHPLLQNRAIDKRRAAVSQTSLARQAVEPFVAAQLLDFVRSATQSYWVWVAAGQSLTAQRQLLELAQDRVEQIEARVDTGDLERITRINNDQLIASRETKAIEAERKLQEAAIKLSLFLRDAQGRPVLASPAELPEGFPEAVPPDAEQIQRDIAAALAARPELVELDLLARQIEVELAQAQNMLWPKLDATVLASKDVGEWADEKGDKAPFELEAGLLGEIPLQRREARGKVEAARGKLSQIRAKRQFTVDKITAEVQDAVSALQAAAARIERARSNLELSRETLQLGRQMFNVGDIDLIALNIYEQAVTDAQLLLISAQVDFFVAEADYRAALARESLPAPSAPTN